MFFSRRDAEFEFCHRGGKMRIGGRTIARRSSEAFRPRVHSLHNLEEAKMIPFLAAILLSTLVMQTPVNSQQPTPSLPSDYVLVTFVLRHDQSRNLEEITKLLEEGFWAKFPPDGITVESWYAAMGLGHIVTLRVPPARVREVNRSIEQNVWKAFRTETYLTYDFREIARSQREKALAK
jgi:hypothetical protein